MPLQEQCRRFLCNPEQSEGEQALPLPGNKLERDPADKEIFKVQLMSEMTHWLNQTKVRLENKNPRCKEQGWWGCKRQRMRRKRRQPVLLGAEGQSNGCGLGVIPGLPQICPRLGTWGLRRRLWTFRHAAAIPACSLRQAPSPSAALMAPFLGKAHLSGSPRRCCLQTKHNSPSFTSFVNRRC